MRMVLLVLFLCVSSLCLAADPPANHKIEPTPKQLLQFADLQADEIARVEKLIAERKASIKNIKSKKLPRKKRQNLIAGLEAWQANYEMELKELKAGQMPRSRRLFAVQTLGGNPSGLRIPSVGQAGVLSNMPITVLQIVDDDALLVRVGTGSSLTVLLKLPTAGLVDDVAIKLNENRMFVVSGTHRYAAVGGSVKTVLLIEEVNMASVRDFLRRQAIAP